MSQGNTKDIISLKSVVISHSTLESLSLRKKVTVLEQVPGLETAMCTKAYLINDPTISYRWGCVMGL